VERDLLAFRAFRCARIFRFVPHYLMMTEKFVLPRACTTWLATILALALAGCASISVQPHSQTEHAAMPRKIYVTVFEVHHGDFRVDRDGAELTDFKKNLRTLLQSAMVADLTRRLIPAEGAALSENFHPQHAWLVRGEFTRVYQGSRLLRGAIGFGLGATKVETKVSVYDLDKSGTKPFLVFFTTGGSNAEPGAITGIATDPLTFVVSTALSGAGNVAHGLTEDTRRTAREITAELSDYMYHRGWIDTDKWIKPKHTDTATD
jgi:hypothetical protein